MILVLAAGATTVTIVRQIIDAADGGEKVSDYVPMRVVIGGTVVTVVLLGLSEAVPRIATGMAVIIAMSALAYKPDSFAGTTAEIISEMVGKRLANKDDRLSVVEEDDEE